MTAPDESIQEASMLLMGSMVFGFSNVMFVANSGLSTSACCIGGLVFGGAVACGVRVWSGVIKAVRHNTT